MKNEYIVINDNNKMNTLPNVELKTTTKIPEGAKRIGNYILGKTIGSGTFGKVHMGMHVLTGQKVAVKIIEKAKIQGKDIQRVKNQIYILRTTTHRNLIHLYQIIQTQNSLLLITEFMSNGELFTHIVRQKIIPQKEACSIFHQIIDGVQYLHRMRITHRDLKLENIMIDYDNQVKIIDFGLSRAYSKNQRLYSPCGSPCYASPQMIQRKGAYDPQTIDIWSCGVILYAMICGSLPFVESETPKLYKKIVSGNYRAMKGMSKQAKDLIQKILVVNPEKRITVAQIKQHPWWNCTKYQPSYGLSRDERIQYDQDIVDKTAALGFERQRIIQSLQKNQKNKQTGAYYILMKKIVKAGQVVSKYIGSSNFNQAFIEYPFKALQQETSQTVIDSADCQAQMPQTASDQQDPTCTCTENVEPFQWWVFVGTKEYEKMKATTIKQPSEVQFVARFINKKTTAQEQQAKHSTDEEQRTSAIIQQQRRKDKQDFYGNNYEQFNKGTSDLKTARVNRQAISPDKHKQRLAGRVSTIDRFRKPERTCANYSYKLSVSSIYSIKHNLPRILKNRNFSISTKPVEIIELPKNTSFNRKLGRLQRDITQSFS